MKLRILTISVAIVMLAAPAFAQQAQPTPAAPSGAEGKRAGPQGPTQALPDNDHYKYVVRRGDTLWALAGRFMDNPFNWPLIWQENPQIEDPHWIYPGDVLLIIPEEVLRLRKIASLPVTNQGGHAEAAGPSRPQETAAFQLTGPGETQVTFTPNRLIGFMSEEELSNTVGSISGSPIPRISFGSPDLLYIDVGEESGIKVGDKFTVFRLIKNVRHPVTHKKLGYQVLTLGSVEVVVVYPSLSTVKITYSNQAINIQDRVIPLLDMPRTVEFRDAPKQYQTEPLEAYIITNRDNLLTFGRNDIAYIDVGKEEGVAPGMLFTVYVPGKEGKGRKRGVEDTPDEVIGEVVVLMAGQEYSTVLITKSTREFHSGSHIRSRRYP